MSALAAAILGSSAVGLTSASAQGIVADGNAVMTGFSGVVRPTLIAPGVNPAERTMIDPNGPSVRVIDLQAPGAPPQGRLVSVQKPLTVTAAQVGQVFAVALDNATPPNVYVAATSVYGLPTVVPGAGGVPDRIEQGGPNVRFMAGLFGPAAQQGGPGSIWRIDGTTGAVRLFANVALDGVPNGGAALGGLAFDPASNSLLVADRETGMIHRLDLTGAERDRYDHGTQGRPAAGLAPMPFNPAGRLSLANPAFQPANPDTWGHAPAPRRVFGLAVRDARLYYAVAEGLQIWSVGLGPDGAFGADARVEVTVPPGPSASEIAKIAFDDQGRMLVAERVAPSGAFDFLALTEQGGGRVLRFERSGGTTGEPWRPAAGDPDVGLDPRRSGNGGVAIGYGYDAGFRRASAVCAGALWWTGEQLAPSSPSAVNGLQGRPEGATATWLIDFDDRLDDPQARGHVGDVAVLRLCAPVVAAGPQPPPPGGLPPGQPPMPGEPPLFGPDEGPFTPGPGPGPDVLIVELWPDWPLLPPPVCPVGTHSEPNGVQCCPAGQIPGVTGVCQSACSNGSMVPADIAACIRGFQPGNAPGGVNVGVCWNGAPATKIIPAGPNTFGNNKCPKPPLKRCPSGFTEVAGGPPPMAGWPWSNVSCVPNGPACPAGQQRNQLGVCQALCPGGALAWPVNRCCVDGTAVNALGQCPGLIAPPQWYLDFLATGTGPCLLPDGNCSYYEFTITGRQSFGRGSLTQRITLPPGSNFSNARIMRGSRFCPASAWTCTKSGNAITCTAEDCGLAPGDQVVLRTEGRVVPHLTQPPPQPIDQTACGTLEWQAVPGPGTATIARPGQAIIGLLSGPTTPGQATPGQRAVTPSQQACWTIRVLPRPPVTPPPTVRACAPGYVETATGQCCLAGQMTAAGQCCPPGQRPDQRRRTCVPITATPPGIIQVLPPQPRCETGLRWDGRRCVPVEVERPCPEGTTRVGQRCVPIQVERPCPPGTTRIGRRCVQIEQPCPPGTTRLGRRCVQVERPCPPGMTRIGRGCVPTQVERPCPPGTSRIGRRCVPNPRVTPRPQIQQLKPQLEQVRPVRPCPPGMRRVGDRCVQG